MFALAETLAPEAESTPAATDALNEAAGTAAEAAETAATGGTASQLETIWNNILNWLITSGVRLLIAIVVLFISFWIINMVARSIRKKLDKILEMLKNEAWSDMATKTFIYIGKIAAKCLVVGVLVAFVGIDTSIFSALFASIGVTIGLAVNGALGNAAGGILLLITRPFKIDDFVEIAGNLGTVEDIKICNTKLRTLDNKVVYIPNGLASSSTVINYSEKDLRRVDIDFSISYSSDSARALEIIRETAAKDPRVLNEPAAPFAEIGEYNNNAVVIKSRNWVNNADYWDVYFNLMKEVRKALEAEGITVPFQQVDVHIKQN